MDSSEATKVVIDRISRVEPEPIAKKIIGFIYFLGLSNQEMIRLALGPDALIYNLIRKAKTARLLASPPVISPPVSPTINLAPFSDRPFQLTPFPAPAPALRRKDPYLDPQLPYKMIPSDYTGLVDPLVETMKSGPSGFPNDYYCPEVGFNSIKGCRNSPSLIMDYPVKTCHYFSKGFCKHGSNCRYYHRESFLESHLQMFSNGSNSYKDDQVFSPGSLEELELEITDLLKSRRGYPVSIASLPMMYYEKYGRTLQAEGYLTESQRHGKAGYSLTKLLGRLKNSICLIDRPHGQHAVILSEDAPKYMDIRGERNDPGPIVIGSRQIYLTFPAESTFNEENISSYFSTFGPVQDVRIPCQQKRMFGFVTFVSADTVKLILSNGNPHYVCGARVLVKPYREKSKLFERKYLDKLNHPMYYHHARPIDVDSELQTYHLKFPSAECFSLLLDALNSSSVGDDISKLQANNCGDQESNISSCLDRKYILHLEKLVHTDLMGAQGLNLPDSPFASAVASSVSAVI